MSECEGVVSELTADEKRSFWFWLESCLSAELAPVLGRFFQPDSPFPVAVAVGGGVPDRVFVLLDWWDCPALCLSLERVLDECLDDGPCPVGRVVDDACVGFVVTLDDLGAACGDPDFWASVWSDAAPGGRLQ